MDRAGSRTSRWRWLASLVAVFSAGAAGNGGEVTAQVPAPDIQRITLDSRVLGEARMVDVALPPSYETSSFGYPTLYVLDGPSNLEHVRAATRFLSSLGLMPEVLIVAVHNTHRERDLTPPGMDLPVLAGERASADRFAEFLFTELVPRVEEDFRTEPLRLLVGHSSGALFGAWITTRQPDLFRWEILLDGPYTLADGAPMRWMTDWAGTEPHPRNRLVFFDAALGWTSEGWQSFRQAAGPLRTERFSGLDETHESLPYEGVYEGLKWLFQDYPGEGTGVVAPDQLRETFAALSREYGATIPPGRRRLLRDASDLLAQNRKEDARSMARWASELYGPTSAVTSVLDAIDAAPADGPQATTGMEDWLDLPRPTREEMEPYLGEWRGTIQTGSPTPVVVTFEMSGDSVVGRTVRPGPGGVGRDTLRHAFHSIKPDGTFLYGHPNGMRPGGMVVYTMHLSGERLEGEQTLEAVVMPEGLVLPYTPVELEREADNERTHSGAGEAILP